MNPGWEERMKLKEEKIQLLESGFKKCTKCKEIKTIDNFWQMGPKGRTLDGRTIYCRDCFRIIIKTPHLKRNKNKSARLKQQKLRNQVFTAYGGYSCNCSGCNLVADNEAQKSFFTLDHINNDGAQERRNGLKGTRLYKKIIHDSFPSTYQVLCWNCNLSKQINHGICAHNLGE